MNLESVIIVDDMKLARLKLTQVCKTLGFKNIIAFSSGDDAWKELSKGQMTPDLILTDYHMPGTNGIELLEKIRAHSTTASVPVIFVTTETEQSLLIDAMSKGVTDFINKPYSDQDLATKIEKAMAKPG